ncbi:50S ribosomal protein L24 [Candidatus Micrarchaeota archaeon]|nr:50S ribosomal protein L24 [Candidatus Micrarchaeota archaeon]
MKSDTERRKYYKEKLHRKKNRLHVHLSKDLRGKMKARKRAILVHKGDTVKIMRGPGKGKETKVARVSTVKRKVYAEGVSAKNIKGRDMPVALEPSNLLLVGLESTKERKQIFSEDIFRKKAEPKKEGPKETEKTEPKAEETKPIVPKAADAPKAAEAPKR